MPFSLYNLQISIYQITYHPYTPSLIEEETQINGGLNYQTKTPQKHFAKDDDLYTWSGGYVLHGRHAGKLINIASSCDLWSVFIFYLWLGLEIDCT